MTDRIKGKPRLATAKRHYNEHIAGLYSECKIFTWRKERGNKKQRSTGQGIDPPEREPRTLYYCQGSFGLI